MSDSFILAEKLETSCTIIAKELLNSYFIPLCPFWWVVGGIWVNKKCILGNEGQTIDVGAQGVSGEEHLGIRGVLELSHSHCRAGRKQQRGPIVSQLFRQARDPQGLASKAGLQECCRNSLQTAGVWRLSLRILRSFHLYLVPDAMT